MIVMHITCALHLMMYKMIYIFHTSQVIYTLYRQARYFILLSFLNCMKLNIKNSIPDQFTDPHGKWIQRWGLLLMYRLVRSDYLPHISNAISKHSFDSRFKYIMQYLMNNTFPCYLVLFCVLYPVHSLFDTPHPHIYRYDS